MSHNTRRGRRPRTAAGAPKYPPSSDIPRSPSNAAADSGSARDVYRLAWWPYRYLLPLSGYGCQLLGRLELPLIQSRVQSTPLQQIRVPPLLDHLTMIHDQDDVRCKDRGKPVRDHQRCPTLEERPQRHLDQVLGLGVEVGGRLV